MRVQFSERRNGCRIKLTSGRNHRISTEVWASLNDANSGIRILREAVDTQSNVTISHVSAETYRAARARPAVPPPTIRMSYDLFENAAASVVVFAGMVSDVVCR